MEALFGTKFRPALEFSGEGICIDLKGQFQQGTVFSNGRFEGATMIGVIDGMSFLDATFIDCKIGDNELGVLHSNFQHARFYHVTFESQGSVESSFFCHTVFERCKFTGLTFSYCDFIGATFLDCEFDNCTFKSSLFEDASFTNCTFKRCVMKYLALEYADFRACKFFDTTVSGRQALYVFGFEELVKSSGIKFHAEEGEQDQFFETSEYLNRANQIVDYLRQRREYFPLINFLNAMSITTNLVSDLHDSFKFYLDRRDYRAITRLTKLMPHIPNAVLSSKKIVELYKEYCSGTEERLSKIPSDFSAIDGYIRANTEIRDRMLARQDNKYHIAVHIGSSDSLSMEREAKLTQSLVAKATHKGISIKSSQTRNSPPVYDLILAFTPEQIEQVLEILTQSLPAVGHFFEQIASGANRLFFGNAAVNIAVNAVACEGLSRLFKRLKKDELSPQKEYVAQQNITEITQIFQLINPTIPILDITLNDLNQESNNQK